MSRRFDLKCLDCGEQAGFELNHGAETLRALWASREVVVQAAPAREALVEVELYWRTGPGGADLRWLPFFVKHRDHRVVPFDEYGLEWDQCQGQVVCGCCGHRRDCQLKLDHVGEHARKA